jgi:hypothetical protein
LVERLEDALRQVRQVQQRAVHPAVTLVDTPLERLNWDARLA